MSNIMIDIESMATDGKAVVVSLGAVYFDPKTGLGKEFYVVLDRAQQEAAGRSVSPRTMEWWGQQTPEARSVFEEPTTDVEKGLLAFSEFVSLSDDRDVYMWGNGADFDNVIVGSLYEDFGIKRPWSYSNNRCYRTLKNLVHPAGNLPKREGTHHNGLDDAKHQALCAVQYLKGELRK